MTDHRDIGLEQHDGHSVGRDPRTMSADELVAIGHQRMSPIRAIRARCVDCCGGSLGEVRKCVATNCPAWPFRMGKNPWRTPPSGARRSASRASVARINADRKNNGSTPSKILETTSPGISLPKMHGHKKTPLLTGRKS